MAKAWEQKSNLVTLKSMLITLKDSLLVLKSPMFEDGCCCGGTWGKTYHMRLTEREGM